MEEYKSFWDYLKTKKSEGIDYLFATVFLTTGAFFDMQGNTGLGVAGIGFFAFAQYLNYKINNHFFKKNKLERVIGEIENDRN